MKQAILGALLVSTTAVVSLAQGAQASSASWQGTLRDAAGRPVSGATIELSAVAATSGAGAGFRADATSDSSGSFSFPDLPAGDYALAVVLPGRKLKLGQPLRVRAGERLQASITVSADERQIDLLPGTESGAVGSTPEATRSGAAAAQSTGGANLSSKQVSSLPLNKRDFSQLLTLAAGTTTDTNGASNFTQQFAVNGQRGTTAVFAMDGFDVTDPELGGATLANFNVDAIQEIRSDSGVMPASVGEGAAGFTNVITKSGTADVHGDAFEFLRNSALDARNFFDRRSFANPGRIPPFRRNEFGFTNGGPLVLPGFYNGHGRTFYFGEYQGFRQVLSTTQVLSVPTAAERQGMDTTAFRGDTLMVPVNSQIAPILQSYPLPNDPQGAFGARTYATSSKVTTLSDQFSIRIDHRISEQSQLNGRFSFNQNNGPTTNPNQTAIDPSFALDFLDHQRNAGLHLTHTFSARFTSDTSFGFIRSTPLFTSRNRTQPGILFGDGLYEPFNGSSGAIFGAWGNLFQLRQSFAYARGSHTFQVGFEARLNRDTTVFGLTPNGQYTFGGGTAYAPVAIPSASGTHNIAQGDPLPDALAGFLTGTPYSFTATVAGPQFPQGDRIDEAAIRRNAYNGYFRDTWKITPRLSVDYGLRYEANGAIGEAHHLTSAPRILGQDGRPARFWDPGARQVLLVNPQPPYPMDWGGWGPRLAIEWQATEHTTVRAGAGITTLLPNLFADNAVTGAIPFALNPFFAATPGAPVTFNKGVATFGPPQVFTPQGQPIYATGKSMDVPANTPLDLQRLEDDLARLSPGHQAQALLIFGQANNFPNGYIETFTLGLSHDFRDLKFNASYVGTAGVKLVNIIYPNSYSGADPAFAPFTRFDASGHVLGGIGPETLIGTPGHSTFHSVEADISKTSPRLGLGFQASYTFSKSIDNASTVFAGPGGGSSTILQANPQDPWHPGSDKGPSTFDITNIFSLSLIQNLPFDRITALNPFGRLASGWEFLNITTLTTGSPFTVFSGIQQTGYGAGGADRPDQIGRPVLSTNRIVREDYFGAGDKNPDFFSIPIEVPGGTGPNHGRLGTLGRDTFRGPGYHNFDVALMKDTTLGRRAGSEAVTLQFRAEFFNALNLVNFSLPSNIVRGTGFGVISRTAGTSRQLQFSLKLIY